MKLRRELTIRTDRPAVGDTIRIRMKNERPHTATVVKVINDHIAMFSFNECLDEYHCMNEEATNKDGWHGCDMWDYLENEVLPRFPKKLRKRMVPFDDNDYLRLHTIEEVFGMNDDFEAVDGVQLDYFKDGRNRIRTNANGSATYWWLASPLTSYATYFCYVNGSGTATSDNAANALGVAPCFLLDLSKKKEEI